MRARLTLLLLATSLPVLAGAQTDYSQWSTSLREKGLKELGAFSLLRDLTIKVGARKAGSPAAEKAVQWGKTTMERMGFQKVRLVPCMVPHWVRGKTEELTMADGSRRTKLTICALGGSIGTAKDGLAAEVIEVKSVAEAAELGDKARGKFVFFNGPMNPALTNTFGAYGGAVGQRVGGAVAAAKAGGVGALVRSMTMDPDDVPHTGTMRYEDGVAKVPTGALSIVAAEKLSAALRKNPRLKVRLKLSCRTLPDVPSASVIGEITGSEKPNEVIVMGGHLDSWDKGTGAHDDGAGVTQSLEALRLLKELGWKPKRTIRVVLFMDEESSGAGADAYAEFTKAAGEKAYVGLESDSGGFAPRAFSTSVPVDQLATVNKWLPALAPFEIDRFNGGGGGGADVGPLREQGAVLFGLIPESQRYFDYHHSDKDTLDKVNPRELELGALGMAMLVWLLSEEGLG